MLLPVFVVCCLLVWLLFVVRCPCMFFIVGGCSLLLVLSFGELCCSLVVAVCVVLHVAVCCLLIDSG